ncbi:MAG: glycosyltransferase [Alphaproteobacteria bacterium]|nr:glycosyltransferase [Alphaproteobacteria bacterium]
MKVMVSTHGRFHAFELAKGLHDHSALHQLLTPYPVWAVRKVTGADMPVRSAVWIELVKRLSNKARLGSKPDAFVGKSFGKFAARTDMADADIFVGWSNASLEAIPVAHAAGLKVIIERGSSHIEHQTEVLKTAYQALGMKPAETSVEVIERELAEYDLADAIAVPSQFAAKTFTDRGVSTDKLIINNYGVDLTRFTSSEKRTARDIPKILFVGQVGVRKGIPNLLKAFETHKDNAELHLVGPIEPGFESYLRDSPTDGVVINGPVAGNALPAIYKNTDIFCLPSLEEGFPLVNLQALTSGCPIITTEAAGAADIIQDGRNGLIIANDSVEALTDALQKLIGDATLRNQMSGAAIASVQDGFTWEQYVSRAMATFENLLS